MGILIGIAILDVTIVKVFGDVSLEGLDVFEVEGGLQPEAEGPTFRDTGFIEVGVGGQFFQ